MAHNGPIAKTVKIETAKRFPCTVFRVYTWQVLIDYERAADASTSAGLDPGVCDNTSS